MSTYVFIGPTISRADAERYLQAVYLPPARQGDVAKLLGERPAVIGIVDGYFEHVASVWHKEILLALEHGVRVYGAASMGALRGAELSRFGMIGVGQIYEWFQDGTLVDDDEVAVVHAPAEQGFRELSDAMVNIRDDVRAAQQAEIIDPPTSERLLAIAKALFYRERSYRRILAEAKEQGLPDKQLADFETFVRAPRDSLKKRDAIAMLERMAQKPEKPSLLHDRFTVERTIFLERLLHEVEMARVGGSETQVSNPAVARGESSNEGRLRALLRYLAVEHAARLGIRVTPQETQQMADDFRLAHGLREPADMERWLGSAGLTLERFSQAMYELATVDKLEWRYRQQIDARLLDQVRLDSARGAWKDEPGGGS